MTITGFKGPKARGLLLAGVLLVGAGATFAVAQGRYAHRDRDPASMPEFRGTVAQYSLTPRGDVDGLILADGTEIHVPPHLGRDLRAAVGPGDAVTVHGEKQGPVVRAGSVAGAATGRTVVDRGPPPGGPRDPTAAPVRQAMEESGVVKMALHGPRGELNGVMLQNGTAIHLPPKEATRFAELLRPGQTIAARGEGVDEAAGRSIGARAIGASMDKLTELAVPPAPPPAGPGPRGPAGRPG